MLPGAELVEFPNHIVQVMTEGAEDYSEVSSELLKVHQRLKECGQYEILPLSVDLSYDLLLCS